MLKYLRYMLLIVTSFLFINMNVKAETEARCVYDLGNEVKFECNMGDSKDLDCSLTGKNKYGVDFNGNVDLKINDFKNQKGDRWVCPEVIYYQYDMINDFNTGTSHIQYSNFQIANSGNGKSNLIISESGVIKVSDDEGNTNTNNTNSNGFKPMKCEDLGETLTLLKQIYNLIRFLVPVLIIVFSIVDFLKVLLNGEEKVYKEAWTKFIKRIVIGIVIIILPIILSLIINISGFTDQYGLDKNNIFCIFE